MFAQTEKIDMSGENVAVQLARLVANDRKNSGSGSTVTSSSSSHQRREEELPDEEKRQRQEERMKKRLEKDKKKKREKMRDEMSQKNETKSKQQQQPQPLSDKHHTPTIEASKTTSSVGGEKSLKLKIKMKKKPEQTAAVLETAKSGKESKSEVNREKSKKSKPPKISFPINEECTSIKLAPSGRHVIAGFTDGTLRLFDTTGRLWKPRSSSSTGSNNSVDDTIKSEISSLFDSDSDEESGSNQSKRSMKQRMVASKSFQNFGAVACQIHAKGVITSLLMDVDCCEDGKFAFGGVLRGSTELIAVDLSEIEHFHDKFLDKYEKEAEKKQLDILDLIKVYRYSDAKLKGFGACIKLKNTGKLEYRLFTGKGIKNMHIWSFVPPSGDMKEPSWQCLYDTPTNGNTISYLKFRRDAYGLLQGISKSDDQKLRIWDLSYEEHGPRKTHPHLRSIIKQLAQKSEKEACEGRPKRPPYVDVLSTENALGVCGAYVFSGGDSMYNKMGVMYLDVEDIQSQFNHTELALPSDSNDPSSFLDSGRRSARTGRQQRGDLKSVVKVAGLGNDAHHVLLELSDQTLVHYCQKGNQSSLTPLRFYNASQAGRKIGVSYVNLKDSYVLTISSYEATKSRGVITLRYLSDNIENGSVGHSVRMAFTEGKVNPKKKFEDGNVVTKKNLKPAAKDVSVSLELKSPITESTSVCDEKYHPKYVSDSKRCRPLVKTSEKAENRKELTDQRNKVSNSQRMRDDTTSNPPRSNEVTESRKSKSSVTPPSLTPGDRLSKTLDISRSTSNPKNLKRTETTTPISSRPEEKSDNAETGDKSQKRVGASTIISSNSAVRDKKTLVPAQLNKTKIHKSEVNAIGTQNAAKKEDESMSTKSISRSKGEVTCVGSNSIHTRKVDKKSIVNTPVLKIPATSNQREGYIKESPLPLTELPNVEKNNTSNAPTQRNPPAGKKNTESQKHLALSASIVQMPEENFVSTSPVPSKLSNANNFKYTKSCHPSKEGTNEFNLLVTPEFKNREKSLLKLKTPVDSTEKLYSDNVNPVSLHVIDDQKCLTDVERLNLGNQREDSDRTNKRPNRAAVSPEQSKKESTSLSDNPVVGKSKSISKFFTDASAHKRMKPTANKNEVRKRSDASKKDVTEVTKKRKQLYQEIDVATALCELRRIASYANTSIDQTLNSIVQSPSSISKSSNEMEDYLAQCHKRKRPKFSHPTYLSSVCIRTGINVPVYKNNGTIFCKDTGLMSKEELDQSHFEARRRLAMHHRASHERLRSAVISSGERVMNLITCNIGSSNYSKTQFSEFITCALSQELEQHRETLNDMLNRQRMEAQSLASTQMLEKGREAPTLSVSFPFPEIFDQVKQSTMKFLSTV